MIDTYDIILFGIILLFLLLLFIIVILTFDGKKEIKNAKMAKKRKNKFIILVVVQVIFFILLIATGVKGIIIEIDEKKHKSGIGEELMITNFNRQFSSYEGEQVGASVKDLLEKILTNITTNGDSDDKLPDIVYYCGEGPTSEKIGINWSSKLDKGVKSSYELKKHYKGDKTPHYIQSNASNSNENNIIQLKNMIQNRHYYQVYIDSNSETFLIDCITIVY